MSLKFAALFILIQRNWSNDITGRGKLHQKSHPYCNKSYPAAEEGGVEGELALTEQAHLSFKEPLNLLFLHYSSQKLYLVCL